MSESSVGENNHDVAPLPDVPGAARSSSRSSSLRSGQVVDMGSTYRNPLDESVTWKPVKIHVPAVWWVFFALSVAASLVVLYVGFFRHEWLVLSWKDSMSFSLLAIITFSLAVGGYVLTLLFVKKPLFRNYFHTLLTLTSFLWGFGGVAGLSSVFITSLVDSAASSSNVLDVVSLVLAISLWTGVIVILPLLVVNSTLPKWERRPVVLRMSVLSAFWGAYAGVMLTLVAPYAPASRPVLFIVLAVVSILPIGGILALGVAVAFPVRWKVSPFKTVNVLGGIAVIAYGFAVFLSVLFLTELGVVAKIALGAQLVALSVLGPMSFVGSVRGYGAKFEQSLEGLQVWVDADIVRSEEVDFLLTESDVRLWEREALRRGVFWAARDYYRALTRLAFVDFDDPRARDLVDTVKATRRKLEAAGVPPRPDFLEFSDVAIFPDVAV